MKPSRNKLKNITKESVFKYMSDADFDRAKDAHAMGYSSWAEYEREKKQFDQHKKQAEQNPKDKPEANEGVVSKKRQDLKQIIKEAVRAALFEMKKPKHSAEELRRRAARRKAQPLRKGDIIPPKKGKGSKYKRDKSIDDE